VRVSFVVKAGSLTDLSKKHKSSLGQQSQLAQSVGMFALDMCVTAQSVGMCALDMFITVT